MYFASKAFWVDALERVVSTTAQTLLALAGVSATDLVSLNWPQILIASGLSGAIALAKALAVGGISEIYIPRRSSDA